MAEKLELIETLGAAFEDDGVANLVDERLWLEYAAEKLAETREFDGDMDGFVTLDDFREEMRRCGML